jgi:Fe-S-cluster containining protein
VFGKLGISETAEEGKVALATDFSVGSQLCTRCGLCCTGALHNFAVLEPEEIPFARELGLTLRTEGRPGFALPCPYLKDCSCSIYASRPKVCERYMCQLLDDVREGKTALQTALELVEVAKQLYADVQALLTANTTFPEARLLLKQALDPDQSDEQRSTEMHLRLALATLCVYLDKHFKHWRESKLLTMTPIDHPSQEERSDEF